MINFLVLKRKNSLWRQPVWDFFMVFGLPGGILTGLQEKKLVSFRHTFGVANCAKSFGSHQAAEIICWVPETSMDCFEGPEDAMFFHVDGKMEFTGVAQIWLLSDDEQNENFFDHVNLLSQITSGSTSSTNSV